MSRVSTTVPDAQIRPWSTAGPDASNVPVLKSFGLNCMCETIVTSVGPFAATGAAATTANAPTSATTTIDRTDLFILRSLLA